MQSEDARNAAGSRVSKRNVWAPPRVTRLAASEAELFLAGGPDSELTS